MGERGAVGSGQVGEVDGEVAEDAWDRVGRGEEFGVGDLAEAGEGVGGAGAAGCFDDLGVLVIVKILWD